MADDSVSSSQERKQFVSEVKERLKTNTRVIGKLFQQLPNGSRHILILGEGGILVGLLFITRLGFLWVVILSAVLLASIRLKSLEGALDQEPAEEPKDEIEEQIAEKETDL